MSYHEALDTLFQQPLVEQARRIAEQYSMQAEHSLAFALIPILAILTALHSLKLTKGRE